MTHSIFHKCANAISVLFYSKTGPLTPPLLFFENNCIEVKLDIRNFIKISRVRMIRPCLVRLYT